MKKGGHPFVTFLLNVVGIMIATVILSPLAMPIVDFLMPWVPGMPAVLDADKIPGGYDFARVWRTVNQIVIMVFLVANMRQMGFTSFRSLGFAPDSRWRNLLWQGFFWGLVAYMLVVAITLIIGVRGIQIRTPWYLWIKEPAEFMLSGAAAGLVEEVIFRGMFFPVLARWMGITGSMLFTSLVYASFHLLVDAKVPVKSGAIDLVVGYRGIEEHVWVLMHPRENFFPAFFGLFLMSVILTYAFIWTGSLYFPIGLHAAWVFIDKTDNLFLTHTGLRGWLFGQEGLAPSLFAWMAMGLFLFYIASRYKTRQFRDARLSP